MRRAVVSLGVVGMFVLPGGAAAQPREGRKLQLEQFFDIESVSNPRISPDGTQIVYTRGWVDKINDRRSSALWIMNADGSRNRFFEPSAFMIQRAELRRSLTLSTQPRV